MNSATRNANGPPHAYSLNESADLVVAYLRQLGVEYIFGIPGGAIEPLYNALARSEASGGPRPIVARHESGAAFMADGYARETGRLGVCVATTGPGATNLITGVASAYADQIPMLVITGQTPLPTFGRGAVQESSCTGVDTTAMLKHCTRYNTLVSHVEQLEHKLVSAITIAYQEPKGPVHLSIPLDIQRTAIDQISPRFDLVGVMRGHDVVDDVATQDLFDRLSASQRPVFVVGEGVGDGIQPLLTLATRLGAEVVATPQGKGMVDHFHPAFKGVIGMAGHRAAYAALSHPEVDLVVAVGTALDEFASRCWDTDILLNDRLVHVDAVARHFIFSPMAQLHVAGSIRTIFSRLLGWAQDEASPTAALGAVGSVTSTLEMVAGAAVAPGADIKGRSPGNTFKWLSDLVESPSKCLDDTSPIRPQRLMYELSTRFPAGTRFLADTGNSFIWAIHYLFPRRAKNDDGAVRGGDFRISMGFSSMGWAIGSAVGTALGSKGLPVVSISGDGSTLMSGQELTVAVTERLPIVFVILNDSSLGTVKHGQRLAGAEQVGFQLPPVDFSQMAAAMGARSHRIESPADFDNIDFDAICHLPGPTVLDVRIDPEEVPPMRVRMASLGTGCTE